MKDHPSVTRYARAFAEAMPNRSHDDLLEEAREGYENACLAEATGKYDPHVASFDTYATTSVYRHMCSAVRRERRRVTSASLSEAQWGKLEDASPAPDRVLLLAELIRDLPRDARMMVELVLSNSTGRVSRRGSPRQSPEFSQAIDVALSNNTEVAARKARKYIRGEIYRDRPLRDRRPAQAESAFRAIRSMLGELT